MTQPNLAQERGFDVRHLHHEHCRLNATLQTLPSISEEPPTLPNEAANWASISSVAQLANTITHDLMQPLTEIVNTVWLCRELIRDSSVSTDVHEHLVNIDEQAMRAAEMIRTVRRLVGTWETCVLPANGDATVR